MAEIGAGASESVRELRVNVAAALRTNGGRTQVLSLVGRACLELLPVDGVAVSMMSPDQNRETWYVSDDLIGWIESMQMTLGEGPSFQAFNARRPVLVTDLALDAADAWPVLAAELASHPVGAIFAFPLQIGAIAIGVVDLYRHASGWFSPEQLTTALRIVDVAMVALLSLRPGDANGSGDEWLSHRPSDGPMVHQATGMLIAAHHIPAEQALSRLRGYAFSTGQLIEEVAQALTTKALSPAEIDG